MKRYVLFWLILCSTGVPGYAANVPVLADYAGQYVVRLGQRNLMVLNLHRSGATLAGSLMRPRAFGGNASVRVTNSTVATYNVQSAALAGDHLRLVTGNADRAHDTDTWDLTLTDAAHATLGSDDEGFATDPFPLVRVSAQPQQAVSTDWDPAHAYGPDDDIASSSAMARIFEEDQKARQNGSLAQEQWATVAKADEARRDEVRGLLRRGDLHTGVDFERAAFLFQHGSNPDDYLLAHTLAMVAVARGNEGALWIATATLDRYLQSTGKPQIYGTQFLHKPGTAWTQEPYDRTLISDPLRRSLDVPSEPVQEKQLTLYKKQAAE